eukprot:scaffold1.g5676.t1
MKAKTVQVYWHGKEPVYSLDFHANGTLVTGGGDKEVKVWQVSRGEDGYAAVQHLSSLSGHEKTVNCVRFSPGGQLLVSSGDGGQVVVWRPADAGGGGGGGAPPRGNLCDDEGEATWRRAAVLRGASDDVVDVCWAPDGTALTGASIQREALVWDMTERKRGSVVRSLRDHKHFVQGVAWDPAQQYVVTQSADRSCKVYALKPPAAGRKTKVSQYLLPAAEAGADLYLAATLAKRTLPPAAPGAKPEKQPLFQDESCHSFFRRPAWSPDGALLAVPAGAYRPAGAPGTREAPATYVYARSQWAAPVLALPSPFKARGAGGSRARRCAVCIFMVVAVRFCPVLFERDDGGRTLNPSSCGATAGAAGAAAGQGKDEGVGEAPAAHPIDLPYKMVFAVATLDSVVLYDTQSAEPLALIGNLHYDSITDLAWSSDGAFLAVSSRDAYVSIAAFEPGELGAPLAPEAVPSHVAARLAAAKRAAPAPGGVGAAAPAPTAGRASAQPQQASRRPPGTPAEEDAPQTVEQRRKQGPAPEAGAGAAGAAPAGAAVALEPARAPPSGNPHKRRIQPEPVADAARGEAQAQHEEARAAKKAKHIVLDSVAAPPPTVGDSQPAPALAGAALAPVRRITAQPVEPAAPAATAGGGGEPAPADAAPVPAAAKQPKRITPQLVAPSSAPAAPAAPAGGKANPAESAFSGAAAASDRPSASAARQPKRITPTPLGGGARGAVSEKFGRGAQVAAAPAPSEASRDGGPGGAAPSAQAPGSHRRITPVPVAASPPKLPQGQEVAAARRQEARAAASKPAPKGGGIAALAAMLGKAAAEESGRPS